MKTDLCLQRIRQWADKGVIRPLDYQFASVLEAYCQDNPPLLYLAALTSHQLASGNVCLPLSSLMNAEHFWPDGVSEALSEVDWDALQADNRVLGDGQEECPLILDKGRIYLYRYWQHESYVAEKLKQLSAAQPINESVMVQSLSDLFPTNRETVPDWQQIAAAIAVQKRFAVISGGPGTGKTTTVIKLLALYIEQCQVQNKKPIIRLVAPTGKAAARLSESINGAKEQINLHQSISDRIPTEASTLHRLLGVIPDSVSFRHHAGNPLHLDLLIVDEASMIDLPMMARLLQALPDNARLVLLGDRDQLASVEAGSVLADICNWPDELTYTTAQTNMLQRLCQLEAPLGENRESEHPFTDCLALLRKSYRFSEDSGIGHLSRAVNQADEQQIKHLLGAESEDLFFRGLDQQSYKNMLNQVVDFYADIVRQAEAGTPPADLLLHMSQFQLLCALRSGDYGIEGVNESVRNALAQRGLIRGEGLWFPGRPVMVTRNDASTGLYNGDIGITLADDEGRLKVWFEQNGSIRTFLPSRLPEHESVFAMTVHKSQGSEFNSVALLLPPDDHLLLTRELVYTAITRARKALYLYCRSELLVTASKRVTERSGGLSLRLWGK